MTDMINVNFDNQGNIYSNGRTNMSTLLVGIIYYEGSLKNL